MVTRARNPRTLTARAEGLSQVRGQLEVYKCVPGQPKVLRETKERTEERSLRGGHTV